MNFPSFIDLCISWDSEKGIKIELVLTGRAYIQPNDGWNTTIPIAKDLLDESFTIELLTHDHIVARKLGDLKELLELIKSIGRPLKSINDIAFGKY